jgi:hypothetical protein
MFVLMSGVFLVSSAAAAAQREYPATATIRGENIWLRVEPAEDTDVLAYLQRGDEVLVTGDTTAGDGDAFYPVEVIETAETGWVRDLAIDPRGFGAVATLPDVVIDEPPADQGTNRSNRKSRTRELQALADAGELDCEDFSSQAEAQAFFDSQGWSATNDPYSLDQGGDPGVPCESLS